MSNLMNIIPGMILITFIVALILVAKRVDRIAHYMATERAKRIEAKYRDPYGLTVHQIIALRVHARHCNCGQLQHVSRADLDYVDGIVTVSETPNNTPQLESGTES